MIKRELVDLLAEIYERHGPRQARGGVVPAKQFASISGQQVDEAWDFDDRHLMHRVAYAIARSRA